MTVPNPPQTALSVYKSILVDAPQAHAFAVFTEQQGSWWPLATHHIGKAVAQTAVVEPRAGRRWFQRGGHRNQRDRGPPPVREPPHPVGLGWDDAPQRPHRPSSH